MVLVPNLFCPQIQESSHRGCVTGSIFTRVSAVLPPLMRMGSMQLGPTSERFHGGGEISKLDEFIMLFCHCLLLEIF